MKNFQFQVVITEQCNLACDYCYMNKKPNIMSDEIMMAHVQMLPTIIKSYGCDTYTVGWFGGEPLLNWELVEKWTPIFEKDPKCNNQFIATNGLALGPERQEFLRRYNVQMSISFDGLWNDINRKTKDGKPTLQKYLELKNVLRIHNCKVMVSPDRGGITLAENYKWFVEEFDITSPDFSLVRDDIWHATDVSIFGEELVKLTNMNIDYIKQGKESLVGWYGLYFLDTWAGKRYGKRPFGCFAGNNGLGFMPDGYIYPCARFGSEKEYPVWSSFTGSKIEHNYNMFIDSKMYNPSTFEDCKSCSLYQICNAGCTYSQLKYGDGKAKPLKQLCRLYKMIYSEMGRIIEEVGKTKTFKNIVYNLMRSVG